MSKGDEAQALFKQGLNCSQAVAAAFSKEMNMSEQQVEKLTVGFGGGMGRMREVCGAVSAMTFVISALYDGSKADIYNRVQTVAKEFEKENGSIVCRELLNMQKQGMDSPNPEERTPQYYKKRPCPEIVKVAADILESYIKENPYSA